MTTITEAQDEAQMNVARLAPATQAVLDEAARQGMSQLGVACYLIGTAYSLTEAMHGEDAAADLLSHFAAVAQAGAME